MKAPEKDAVGAYGGSVVSALRGLEASVESKEGIIMK